MANILLTGAAGFIGSHVLRHLHAKHQITAIDNLTKFSNYEIKLHRLQNLAQKSFSLSEAIDLKSIEVDFRKVDILDVNSLEKIFKSKKPEIVIHLAAMTGIRQAAENPALYTDVNVRGFLNILECCRNFGVNQLLYSSSSSVYGSCADVPFREGSDTNHPLSVYAATKKAGEMLAHTYTVVHGINTIGLRLFTVYGPWTRPDMATLTFMKNISEGRAVRLFNMGNMKRDFTFVDDVVESIERVAGRMIKDRNKKPSARIFNIGEGKPVNVKQYLSIIEGLIGKKAKIENAPMQNGEMQITFADCSALEKFTGYKPVTSVEEGLRKTVDWYLKYQE